jgi:hypothetical protein
MTLIKEWLDGLLPNLVTFGRGANTIALRANNGITEIRNPADTAYGDFRLKNLQLDGFASLSRVFGIQRRQAIAQGPISSTGSPNSITAPGGLNAQINASVTNPIVCNFAAGFDAAGIPIDYTGIYTSVQGYGSLTANTTHYFYLERNASTGAVTPTRITIAPVYSRVAPTSPTTGLHWFKTSQDSLSTQPGYTMYEWSGSTWVARQRVFLGEVTTGASAVSNVANYAYDRRYQSAWFAVAAGGAFNFNPNLGMFPAEAEASFEFYARANSSDPNNYLVFPGFFSSGYDFGLFYAGAGTRLSNALYAGSQGWYSPAFGTWAAIGEIMISVSSRW